MKLLFCHSSCYSECSVSEQQISDQQFGNREVFYTFRESGGFIFSPSAAAPLHHTSSKGLCPSVQAWHRNPSHNLLRLLDWLPSVRTGVAQGHWLLYLSLCAFSSSMTLSSVWRQEQSTTGMHEDFMEGDTLLDGAPHSADSFGCFCCGSQRRTNFSKWSVMPFLNATASLKFM